MLHRLPCNKQQQASQNSAPATRTAAHTLSTSTPVCKSRVAPLHSDQSPIPVDRRHPSDEPLQQQQQQAGVTPPPVMKKRRLNMSTFKADLLHDSKHNEEQKDADKVPTFV